MTRSSDNADGEFSVVVDFRSTDGTGQWIRTGDAARLLGFFLAAFGDSEVFFDFGRVTFTNIDLAAIVRSINATVAS